MSSSEKRVRDDRVLLDLLADKWTIHVLGSLCDHGYRRRFNAIRRDIPGLSQKSLVQCLRRLEKSGLVARTVLTTGRLGVEYAFTDLGRTLQRPVAALFEWTTEYAAVVKAAQTAFEVTTADERDAAWWSNTGTERSAQDSSQFCCAQIVNRPSGVSPSKRHDDGFDIDQDTGRPSGATMDVCRNIISWRRTKRTLRPVLFPSYPQW